MQAAAQIPRAMTMSLQAQPIIHDLPKIRNLARAFSDRYRDEPVLVGR